MGISRTVYTIYGLRIDDHADWKALKKDPGPCKNDGGVGAFRAGAADGHMTFLALRCTEVAPGGYVFHSGEQANALLSTRERWNADLRAVAERLGLNVIEGPGWYTIPNEA